MGGIDIYANHSSMKARVEVCPNRTEAFGKNHIRATMEQAKRLGVALHRHAPDQSLWTCLKNLDPHFFIERTAASGVELGELIAGNAGTAGTAIHPVAGVALGHIASILPK